MLQDIDDSADFDSPSHYNYYNGTFNSTPSINDFISQRERYTSLSSVTCTLSRCVCVCVFTSPFFFFFHESSLFHRPKRGENRYFRGYAEKFSRIDERRWNLSSRLIYFMNKRFASCRAGVFVTGCRMAASNSGFCGVRAMPRR